MVLNCFPSSTLDATAANSDSMLELIFFWTSLCNLAETCIFWFLDFLETLLWALATFFNWACCFFFFAMLSCYLRFYFMKCFEYFKCIMVFVRMNKMQSCCIIACELLYDHSNIQSKKKIHNIEDIRNMRIDTKKQHKH